jgi:hypothetical protein
VLYLHVASLCLQWFSNVFQASLQVFHIFVSSVLFVFFYILQLLHLDVLKVLHIGCASEAADYADDFRGGMCSPLVCSLASPTRYYSFAASLRQRPDKHPDASKPVKTNIRNSLSYLQI